MSIQDEYELNCLREAGRIVRRVLDAMKAEVRPGVFSFICAIDNTPHRLPKPG